MEKYRQEIQLSREVESVNRRRLVAKLGTRTMCDEKGEPRAELVQSLARQTMELHDQGIDTVFISSGAVAVGRVLAPEVEDKNLLSTIGQPWLTMAWNKAFYPMPVAQLLFSDEQLEDTVFLRNAVETALKHGVVPVINCVNPETNNDFVGSNVASAIDADFLALLTTTNGVLRDDQTIPVVRSRADLYSVISESVSDGGNGGMGPKAHEAFNFVEGTGGAAFIVFGLEEDVLLKIVDSERHVGTRVVV